jgi:hypothetical protein
MSFNFVRTSGFVLAHGTVFTTHAVANYDNAAVDTFVTPVAVDMFPGGSLKAAVAIRGRSAVNTMFFISIMLMKPVKTFGATGAKFG